MRALIAVIVLVAITRSAHAGDAEDQAAFAAATQQLGDGDLIGARRALEALVVASPRGRWADDALAEAAAISERLGDLASARLHWQRIVDEHGDGRLARRATARLAALVAAGGADGAWDQVAAAHDRLVREAAAAEDPHAALAALAAVLGRNPEYPRRFAATLWLGEAYARIGERRLARVWITHAYHAAATDGERFRAGLADAAVLADAGRLDVAEAVLRVLVPSDPLDVRARDQALAELDRRRTRAAIGTAARIVLALLVVAAAIVLRRRTGAWRGAARALWPPPLEALYLAPVAVVFALVAETGNPLAARAAQLVLGGAVAITWLSGALLRARTGRLGALALAAHLAAVTVAIAAVAWIAIVSDQLLDLLLETWRSGHDMR